MNAEGKPSGDSGHILVGKQAGRDPDLLPNLPAYNILLERRHGVLVRTVVVLLRKSADWAELTGTIQREFPGEPPYLVFRYGVVRVWQLSPEMFLSGGLGILPLAPLSAVAEAALPGVIRRMDERIRAEATADEAGTLWTAADVLMGLRFPRQLVAQLLQGVHGMKESVTYQAIVEEGEVKGRSQAARQICFSLAGGGSASRTRTPRRRCAALPIRNVSPISSTHCSTFPVGTNCSQRR